MKEKKQETIEELIQRDLATRAGEKVKPLFAALSEGKTKLQNLEKKKEEYEREAEGAQQIFTKAIREFRDQVQNGGQVKEDGIPIAKKRLSEIEIAITEIEAAIPGAVEEIKKADEALEAALGEPEDAVKEKYAEEMGKLLNQAMDIFDAWVFASNRNRRSLGLKENAGGLFNIPRLQALCPRLTGYFQRTGHFRF